MSLSSKLGKDFKDRKSQLIGAKLLLALSVVIIALSTMWIIRTSQRVHNSYITTGVVTNFVPKSPTSTLLTPLISYVDRDGKKREEKGQWYSEDPKYRKGDLVEIIYSKDDHSQMQIGGFWNLYDSQILLLCFGILFLIINLFALKYTKELIHRNKD